MNTTSTVTTVEGLDGLRTGALIFANGTAYRGTKTVDGTNVWVHPESSDLIRTADVPLPATVAFCGQPSVPPRTGVF